MELKNECGFRSHPDIFEHGFKWSKIKSLKMFGLLKTIIVLGGTVLAHSGLKAGARNDALKGLTRSTLVQSDNHLVTVVGLRWPKKSLDP